MKLLTTLFSFISELFKKKEIQQGLICVNGYEIRYNELWNTFIMSHEEIGVCGEYKCINDAIEDAKRG